MKTLPPYVSDVKMISRGELELTEYPSGEMYIDEADEVISVKFSVNHYGSVFVFHAVMPFIGVGYTKSTASRWLADSLEGCPSHPMLIVTALGAKQALVSAVSL